MAGRLFRIRFSIFSLLGVTTLAALALGWFVSWRKARIDRARAHAVAVQAIHDAGGNVYFETEEAKSAWDIPPWLQKQLPEQPEQVALISFSPRHTEGIRAGDLAWVAHFNGLRSLSLRRINIGQGALRPLRTCPQLRMLDLSGSQFPEEELAFLEAMPHLTAMDLSSSSLANTDLKFVGTLASLETLDLQNTSITNPGLRHLGRLPRLKTLNLTGTQVTEEGLRHLRGLHHLEELNLRGIEPTDAAARELKHLKSLRVLNLGGFGDLSDRGLKDLSELVELEELHVTGECLTDEGIVQLRGLKRLKILGLGHNSVTRKGIFALLDELPKLEIGWGTNGVWSATKRGAIR